MTGSDGVRVRAKICGVVDVAGARAVEEAGADFMGVILSPGFGRSVSPSRAAELYGEFSGARVGVFVDADPLVAARTAFGLGLDVVQLHGAESPETAARIREAGPWRVWKTIHVRPGDLGVQPGNSAAQPGESAAQPGESAAQLGESLVRLDDSAARLGESSARLARQVERYRETVDGVLADAWDPRAPGGTGRTFAWDGVGEAVREAAGDAWFVVAGGLTPENVALAAEALGPDVVDASSGVESAARGTKDAVRTAAFVAAVRGGPRSRLESRLGAEGLTRHWTRRGGPNESPQRWPAQ